MPESADPADAPSSSDPTPDRHDVEAHAAQLLRDAEAAATARGREMVNQARAVRRRMLDDLEQRRRDLLDELHHLRDVLDRLAEGLDEPVRPPDGDVPPPSPDDEPRADAAFAQLRADQPDADDAPEATDEAPGSEPTPEAPAAPEPPAGPTRDEAPPDALPEPAGEPAAAPRPGDPDDATRRRRDEVLAPLTPPLLRVAKRLLQDEHNDILDGLRRLRGRPDAARVLPDPQNQHAAWSAVLAPTIDEAYAVGRMLTGRRRRPAAAPKRLTAELAAQLIQPLRDRLVVTIDAVLADGPYDSPTEQHAALAAAISARYREWRTHDLAPLLGDLLAVSYARGAYDASPTGATLRWIPAEVGRCPDADDNALEPTLKGQPFPTGQPYPPAHPGCRCLVVPADDTASPRHDPAA